MLRVYPLLCFVFTCMLWSNSGHGGSRTAEYLKNNLFKNLSGHPDFIKDTKTAIGMKLVTFRCYYLYGMRFKLFIWIMS
jgi:hypothetical protein